MANVPEGHGDRQSRTWIFTVSEAITNHRGAAGEAVRGDSFVAAFTRASDTASHARAGSQRTSLAPIRLRIGPPQAVQLRDEPMSAPHYQPDGVSAIRHTGGQVVLPSLRQVI